MPLQQVFRRHFWLLLFLGAAACKPVAATLSGFGAESPATPQPPLQQPSQPVQDTMPIVVSPLPAHRPKPIECGRASFYGEEFAGKKTANGEIFDPSGLSAAHPTLPFGTKLQVVIDGGGRGSAPLSPDMGVIVRINDRGPFSGNRIIDLSRAAFGKIANPERGIINVCLYRIH